MELQDYKSLELSGNVLATDEEKTHIRIPKEKQVGDGKRETKS